MEMLTNSVSGRSPDKRRYGLMAAQRNFANQVTYTKDGSLHSYEVVNKNSKTYKGLQFVCRCNYCQKDFKNEKDLIDAHPDNEILIRQKQAHVYFYFAENAERPELSIVAADDKY